MEENQFNQLEKDGKISVAKEKPVETLDVKKTAAPSDTMKNLEMDFNMYLPFFEMLRQIKRPVDAAPTYTPRSFIEQIVFYKNGTTLRLYLYFGNAWHYVALS